VWSLCLGREQKLEKARATLEQISVESSGKSLSHKKSTTKQLDKEGGSLTISHIIRKKEGTVILPRESQQVVNKTPRISVQWELRDIHDEDLSTTWSSGSMKYPQIKSVSMYTIKECENLSKVCRDICDEEVDI